MPTSSPTTLSPSVFGAVSRFRRIVVILTVAAAVIALLYTGLAGTTYAGKAGVVIAQPPTYLPPFPVSGSHSTLAAYVNQQIAILQSQTVADDAARIVNQKITNAHVTGKGIHGALTVKPQTSASAGTNTTTQVVVSMSTPELAAASANAVIEAYIEQQHAQIKQQAQQSINALNKSIAATTAALNGLPTPTSSTSTKPTKTPPTTPTTRVRVPQTTTTHPRQTTTTHLHTTTTHAGDTTTTPTTAGGTTTSAQAAGHLGMQLTAFDATATTTTTPSTTGATTTPTTAATTSTGGSDTAAQRAVLLSTLINLTRSKTQVSVDEQADLTNQPSVFPATIPGSSSNNNLLRNTFIGALVGLLLGVIAAYVLAVNRRLFERPEEPELVYQVPLVAVVPAFSPSWMPIALPVLSEPVEEPAESFRVIATALRSFRGTDDCILVSFSAAASRSGTTAMVANTGLALAEMGERVLVIDADPIGRGLTRTLTDTLQDPVIATPRTGFSEVVAGCPLIDAVRPADANPRLNVLTSGLDPQLAVNRWSHQAIRLALGDARSNYDVVLIDVPPVGTSSYGMDLASAADHLIMVIPYLDAIAPHEVLPDRLTLAGTHLLGYIFNGSQSRNHYATYFPILHTDTGGGPIPIHTERPALVSATTAPNRPSPPSAGTTTGDAPVDDITTVVPAVAPPDPITEQVTAVDSSSDPVTREVPTVDRDDPPSA
jgi:Mrp family chromosome partitioning ATPase/capsular polysaccharide biosynthesis protein